MSTALRNSNAPTRQAHRAQVRRYVKEGETNPTVLIQALGTAIESMKQTNEARFKAFEKTGAISAELDAKADRIAADQLALKAAVDQIKTALNRPAVILDSKGQEVRPEVAQHRKAFDAYLRRDEAMEKGLDLKALSIANDPGAGYLAPATMDTAIDAVVKEFSPMRALADVRAIGTNSLTSIVNMRGTSSGWVGETDGRAETTPANLSELNIPAMQLYAFPFATQDALDDAILNLESFLADEVSLEFAVQEGAAFIMGTGTKKPRGIIGGYTPTTQGAYAWGAPAYLPTGLDAGFKATNPGDGANNLLDLFYGLKKAYRNNATWLMSRSTLGTVMKMKDSQGHGLWQPSMVAGTPDLINGYPVEEAEDMPTIASNSFSVALGDWKRCYRIVDRMGIRIIRDNITVKGYVGFYTTKRVGGAVKNFEGYKLLKFAAA